MPPVLLIGAAAAGGRMFLLPLTPSPVRRGRSLARGPDRVALRRCGRAIAGAHELHGSGGAVLSRASSRRPPPISPLIPSTGGTARAPKEAMVPRPDRNGMFRMSTELNTEARARSTIGSCCVIVASVEAEANKRGSAHQRLLHVAIVGVLRIERPGRTKTRSLRDEGALRWAGLRGRGWPLR